MEKVIIIAEAGVNHNGDIQIAKKLIDVAVDAGVDYVKFQTFKADTLVSPDAKKASYQNKNINDGDDSQYNMLKKLELSHENHLELMNYCSQKNIQFISYSGRKICISYFSSRNCIFKRYSSTCKRN